VENKIHATMLINTFIILFFLINFKFSRKKRPLFQFF